MTFGELADATIARDVDALRTLIRPLDRERDVEEVHALRVAARRLRTDLGTFRACFAARACDHARRELKWLGRSLAAVRDLDVLEARLGAARGVLAPIDEAALTLLGRHVARERATHARLLAAHLSSARSTRLVGTLTRFVVNETRDASEAQARSRRAATGTERVAKRWKALVRAVGALLRTDDALVAPTDEALHAVRILAKRCRYAAEAMVPVVGDDARRFARAMTSVQSLLGAHQDAVAAESWLRAPSSTTGRTRLVAGELIVLARIERARCRADFAAVWRRASHAKRRTWF